jgi:pimeloyl-ACP methyl ester carboxylesterase
VAKGVHVTVRVDVGGYCLAAELRPGGDPVTVFISGRGDSRTGWARVLRLLRTGTATVTYDRAGIGESDPHPVRTPRVYSALADELLILLDRMSARGPFVVVAHSLGAVIAKSLAARHPLLLAGLILVDGSVDEVTLWPGITSRDGTKPGATLLDYQAGAAELVGSQYPAVPAVVITCTPGRPWPGAPSSEEVDQRWTRHQQATADLFDAALLVAKDAGHYVHHEAAELVALAVDAVVDAVAAGDGVVKLNRAQVAAAGATLVRAQAAGTSAAIDGGQQRQNES